MKATLSSEGKDTHPNVSLLQKTPLCSDSSGPEDVQYKMISPQAILCCLTQSIKIVIYLHSVCAT